MLNESSLDAIEISTEKGLKIRVSKAQTAVAIAPPPPMAAAFTQPAPEWRLSPAAGVAIPHEAAPAPDVPAARLAEVKSPIVGTFYTAPEPGAKPFVTVGTRVSKGQVLCIIEAMKIMNEIESEHAGVLKEIVATDAHPVEYGQVLFRIDDNA